MIESAFCVICNRPYAMYDIKICDSCLKDLEYKIKYKIETVGPKLMKLVNELIEGVDILGCSLPHTSCCSHQDAEILDPVNPNCININCSHNYAFELN